MRSIDIHAHLTPQCFIRAMEAGREWHGIQPGTMRIAPRAVWNPEQRIADMNSLGVDVHVVSTGAGFYFYDWDAQTVAAMHHECNDEVRQMTVDYPDRFKGFAQIPMQDVRAAIAELDRAVNQLGLVGAMINDTVNGRTFDEPDLLPLWKAAEQLNALILFHQEGNDTTVAPRDNHGYGLDNAIGNLADRVVTFASLVFGGVMDKHPNLKVCLAHGGGDTCFGAGRLDRGWQVRSEARVNIQQPPSRYVGKFYYDCLTHSEAALRFIIDTAGVDRVFLGSDWPYDMGIESPVEWVNSLASLTQEEKDAILWKNLEKLLGI